MGVRASQRRGWPTAALNLCSLEAFESLLKGTHARAHNITEVVHTRFLDGLDARLRGHVDFLVSFSIHDRLSQCGARRICPCAESDKLGFINIYTNWRHKYMY